nr:pentapeptide repeat-containing protein [uncultured Campylobacter sp.]
MKEYIINKISSILNIEKKHISYDSIEVLESKCTYLIHIMVTISKDKFEELSRISEVKDFCFPNGAIFKNCVFNKNNFNIFSPCENLLEFIKCEFDGIDGKNLCNSAKYEECSFKNINDFLNFINLRSDNFIKCVYESDFVAYNVHMNEDKFLPKIEIKNWTFKGKVELKNITCNKEISFENVNFNGKIDFSKSTFEKKVSFKKCKFNELSGDDFFDFSEIHFKDNVYFDKSHFNEFVAFHLCVFEKTASFYKTKFNVIPNFSPGDFKGILNINNATWGENGNLEFEDVEKIVDKACGKSEKEEDELETIRNIKDSFRAIKNVLIQENNQLEAQKFHKAELYCKELELEKENKNFSTFIDSLLLKFYRNTSDHHTNFLKILNFTVFCIAVYAVCSFVFVDIYTATFFEESIFFDIKYSESFFNYSMSLLFILAIIVMATMASKNIAISLYSFLFCCFLIIPLLIGLSIFYNFTNQDYALLFKITIAIWISLYFCLIISSHALWSGLNQFFRGKFIDYLREKIIYLSKITFIDYVCKLIDHVCKLVIWVVVAFVLYLYPQLINPFLGVFKSDEILPTNYFEKKLNDLNASEIIEISNLLKNITDLNLTKVHKEIIDLNTITNAEIINAKELIKQNLKEINIADNELNTTITTINDLNTTITTINDLKEKKDFQEYLVNGIKSSSLVYSIILLLCLYSLTKTARKNSIIPT